MSTVLSSPVVSDPSKSAVLLTPAQYQAIVIPRKELLHEIRFPHLSASQFDFVLHVCGLRGLNPWMKHVSAVVRHDPYTGLPTVEIITSIHALRLLAERTGLYDGHSAPEWCGRDGAWSNFWDDQDGTTPPAAARVAVRRRDISEPYNEPAFWSSYAPFRVERGQKVLDEVWAKRMASQLGKCALAINLRHGFPEECAGILTPEEMAQMNNPSVGKSVDGASGAKPTGEYSDSQVENESSGAGPESRAELAGMLIDLGYKTPAQRQAIIDPVARHYPNLCEESPTAFYAKVLAEGRRMARATVAV